VHAIYVQREGQKLCSFVAVGKNWPKFCSNYTTVFSFAGRLWNNEQATALCNNGLEKSGEHTDKFYNIIKLYRITGSILIGNGNVVFVVVFLAENVTLKSHELQN
jgi:hypothetical protein